MMKLRKQAETGIKAPCSFNNSFQSCHDMFDIILRAGDRTVDKPDNVIAALLRSTEFILQNTQSAEQWNENDVLGTKCT